VITWNAYANINSATVVAMILPQLWRCLSGMRLCSRSDPNDEHPIIADEDAPIRHHNGYVNYR